MPSKVTIPNTFATATTAIPLSQLDANFSNVNAAINNALTFSNYAVDTGTANTYTVAITGQTTTYAAGLAIQFLALNTNTGAATLNVNSQGAKTIVKSSGTALTAGDIVANAIVSVMYDGTNFQLLNDNAGGSETFANVTITGTATINVANVTTFSPAITNAQLANSAITIGNTATSLGGTITTINNTTLVNTTISSGNVTATTVSVAAGTVSAPSITFTGDTNTGIYSPAADTIAFTEGGVEAMRIDSSGNIRAEKAVRATITADNDGSFDMNAASNFTCTPTGAITLTFTNITSGQTGNILLVNNSNYAITAAATTKVASGSLTTLSATGTYWLSYYSNGTNVYIASTGALA